jgi:DNA-binding CsgD family transcriptional regulator
VLVDAGFRAYAGLLKKLVELDANDVELSAAELEILREFDRFGGRAVDVAKSLGKSKFTVQNQIQSVIRKLGCSGRAEALAYARQRGWLDRARN